MFSRQPCRVSLHGSDSGDGMTNRRKRRSVALAGLVLLVSCAPQVPPPPSPPPPPPIEAPPPPPAPIGSGVPAVKREFTVVPVYYATDRGVASAITTSVRFNATWGNLRYGKAVVTVPYSHVRGEIEQPQWTRLQFRADPAQHFTIASSKLLSARAWSGDLRATLQQSRRKALLLFVHGYNVPFEDALFRAAQIKHDTMPNGGAAMLFSWPSAGNVQGYTRDEENAALSVHHLSRALTLAITTSGAQDVYVIAHSMGNRVLAGALLELSNGGGDVRAKIKEVILAAPDIDARYFRNYIAPRLVRAYRRTTLYASARDRALAASRMVHGFERVGDTRNGVFVILPIETIDATAASDDLLGHSYIGQSRSVLTDVARLIATGKSPGDRGMLLVGSGANRYWRMPSN